MRRRWRCFHCDEVFTREQDAAEHFGADQGALTACQIKGHEHLLVQKIREQEELIRSYLHEDATVLRAMAAMESDHAHALRRAEEDGYNRGVCDMLTLPATERAALTPEAPADAR
jgi:hypothetical protein